MAPSNQELDRVFHALADTTRRGILTKVGEGDKTVNEIAHGFDMSLPAVSKHLTVLVKAGLITRRKQGRSRICRAEPEALTAATEWLEYYRELILNVRSDDLSPVPEQDS